MPLWKLQVVGGAPFKFLYPHDGNGQSIKLHPGVSFCLRQFHPLITEMVRSAWARYIRQHNTSLLGDATDLNEFLFGSERADLAPVRELLEWIQQGRCFYCGARLRQGSEVDHFIPWVLYPVDLGHNLVLADRKCNRRKSGRLAAEEHLSRWVERNVKIGGDLGREFDRLGIAHNLHSSLRIARWAYGHTFGADGLTWKTGEELIPLSPTWADAFNPLDRV